MAAVAAQLRELRLRSIGIVVVNWFPRFARLMQVFWINSRADLMGHLAKLNMNAMPLTMRMRTQLLFRRQVRLRLSVSLTHRIPPLIGGNPPPVSTLARFTEPLSRHHARA